MIELPLLTTILIDSAAWLVLHLGLAWAVTQLPASAFSPRGWLFRERGWERGGALYERLFRVHRWKRLLPDGAALFRRGFRKKRLLSRDPAYLARFRVETCRGELAHWLVLASAPLFFLWNPPRVGLLMIGYAVLASLPFIVAQRYNRCRLSRLLRDPTVAGGPTPAMLGACRSDQPRPSSSS